MADDIKREATAYNPSLGDFVQTPTRKGRVITLRLSRGEPLYVVHLTNGEDEVFKAADLTKLEKRACVES